MKRNTIFLIASILLITSTIIFWYKTKTVKNTPEYSLEYLFTEFKKSCSIFDASENEERLYQNDITGLKFVYPNDALVCERLSPNDFGKNEQEITIWNKIIFNKEDIQQQPLINIHIDEPGLINIEKPIIISEKKVTIAGESALIKEVKSGFCSENECPIFTIATFSHNGHYFQIELWNNDESILNSFSFSEVK